MYTWASQFCYGKKVLDIGCGEGYGLSIVSNFASKVIGLDISESFLKKANVQGYNCNAEQKVFDLEKEIINEEFDVCLAFEVLEHIDNPKEVLDSLKEKTVIFSVPHAYPHRLHKTDYYSLEDVKKLIPDRDVDWYYLSGTNITKTIPEKIDRYIGVAYIDKYIGAIQ